MFKILLVVSLTFKGIIPITTACTNANTEFTHADIPYDVEEYGDNTWKFSLHFPAYLYDFRIKISDHASQYMKGLLVTAYDETNETASWVREQSLQSNDFNVAGGFNVKYFITNLTVDLNWGSSPVLTMSLKYKQVVKKLANCVMTLLESSTGTSVENFGITITTVYDVPMLYRTAPIAWFSVKFRMTLVKNVYVKSDSQYRGSFRMAYAQWIGREYQLYQEDGKIKEFSETVTNNGRAYILKNPFLANSVRFYAGKALTSDHIRFVLKGDYATKAPYIYPVGDGVININEISDATEYVIHLYQPSSVTKILLDNYHTIESFCIYYTSPSTGTEKAYWEVDESNHTIELKATSSISVQAFTTSKVIIRCVKANYINTKLSVKVTLEGYAISDGDHYWAKPTKQTNQLSTVDDLWAGRNCLIGHQNADNALISKQHLNENLMGHLTRGPACYSRPHTCDGFALQMKIHGSLGSLWNEISSSALVRYKLKDDGSEHFATNLYLYTVSVKVVLYKNIKFSGLVKILSCVFKMPTTERFDVLIQMIPYPHISKNSIVITEESDLSGFLDYTSKQFKDGIAEIFSYDGHNALNLTSQLQTVVNTHSGVVDGIILLMKFLPDAAGNMSKIGPLAHMRMNVQYRNMIIPIEELLPSAPVNEKNRRFEFTFGNKICATKFEISGYSSSHTSNIDLTLHAKQTHYYTSDVVTTESLVMSVTTEGKHLHLLRHFQVPVCTDKFILLFENHDVTKVDAAFYGVKYATTLTDSPVIFPIFTSGLLKFNRTYNGLGIFVHYTDTTIYFHVGTPTKILSIKCALEKATNAEFKLIYKDETLSLLLNGKEESLGESMDGTHSPVAERERFVFFSSNLNVWYSYSKLELVYLKLTQDTEVVNDRIRENKISMTSTNCVLVVGCVPTAGSDLKDLSIGSTRLYINDVYNNNDLKIGITPAEVIVAPDAAKHLRVGFGVYVNLHTMLIRKVILTMELDTVLADCMSIRYEISVNYSSIIYTPNACSATNNAYTFDVTDDFRYALMYAGDFDQQPDVIFGWPGVNASLVGISHLTISYHQALDIYYLDTTHFVKEETLSSVSNLDRCYQFDVRFYGHSISRVLFFDHDGNGLATIFKSDFTAYKWNTVQIDIDGAKEVKVAAIGQAYAHGRVEFRNIYRYINNCTNAFTRGFYFLSAYNEIEKAAIESSAPLPVVYIEDAGRIPIADPLVGVKGGCTLGEGETKCKNAKERLPFLFGRYLTNTQTYQIENLPSDNGISVAMWKQVPTGLTDRNTIIVVLTFQNIKLELKLVADDQTRKKLCYTLSGDNCFLPIKNGFWYHFTIVIDSTMLKIFEFSSLQMSDQVDRKVGNLNSIVVYEDVVDVEIFNYLLQVDELSQVAFIRSPFYYAPLCNSPSVCYSCDQYTTKSAMKEYFELFTMPQCRETNGTLDFTAYDSMDGPNEEPTPNFPYAVVNKANCVGKKEKIILQPNTCKNCYTGMWLKHSCSGNSVILTGPQFAIKCDLDINPPMILRNKDNAVLFGGKLGIWYHLIFKDDLSEVYVNGVLDTVADTTPVKRHFRRIRSGDEPLCMDEYFSTDTMDDSQSLYLSQLYGNTQSMDYIRAVDVKVSFVIHLTAQYTNSQITAEMQGGITSLRMAEVYQTDATPNLLTDIIAVLMENGLEKLSFVTTDVYSHPDGWSLVSLTGYARQLTEDIKNNITNIHRNDSLGSQSGNEVIYYEEFVTDWLANRSTYTVLSTDEGVVKLAWQPLNSSLGSAILGVGIQVLEAGTWEIGFEDIDLQNVDSISLSLRPFTEYIACFHVYTSRFHLDNYHCQPETFTTGEGAPSEGPRNVSCETTTSSLNTSCTITCNFKPISDTSWNGIPHSYKYYWSNDSILFQSINSTNWNLTGFESENLTYSMKRESYDVYFPPDYTFSNMCVVLLAATQNGTAEGVQSIQCFRTCEGAPEGPLVSLNFTTAVNNTKNFTWSGYPPSIEVWNVEDLSQTKYVVEYFNFTRMEQFNRTTHVWETKKEELNIQEEEIGVNALQVYGYSVAAGEKTPLMCWISLLTEPHQPPQLTMISAVNSTAVSFDLSIIHPLQWRGSEKYILMKITDVNLPLPKSFLREIRINLTDPIIIPQTNTTTSKNEKSIVTTPQTERQIATTPNTEKRAATTEETENLTIAVPESENLIMATPEGEESAITTPKTKTIPQNIDNIEKYTTLLECNVQEFESYFKQNTSFAKTFDGMNPYRKYNLTFSICNKIGCSRPTKEFSIETPEDTPSCSPKPMLSQITSTSVNISWSKTDILCANGIITGYIVNIWNDDADKVELLENESSFLVAGLQPYRSYTAAVKARTSIGDGIRSTEKFKTLEDVPSSIPDVLDYHITNTSVFLNITTPAELSINGVLRNVTVFLEDDTFWKNLPVVNGTSFFEQSFNLFELDELIPNKMYTFQLAYATSVGSGNKSQLRSFKTLEGVPIQAPSMQWWSDDVSTISFNVTQLTMEESRGVIVGYSFCDSLKNSTCRLFNLSRDDIYEIDGLHRDAEFLLKIAAVTRAGVGVYSSPVLVYTKNYTDGNWTEWEGWGSCTHSCGGGTATRKRYCISPIPTPGGYNCTGNNTKTKICNLNKCSAIGTTISGSGDCNKACEMLGFFCSSIQYHIHFNLTILNCKPPSDNDNAQWSKSYHPSVDMTTDECHGYLNVPRYVPCDSPDIPSKHSRYCNCVPKSALGLLAWSSWSLCSTSCGESEKIRQRECVHETCIGPTRQVTVCPKPPCPVDGGWGSWSNYSDCSVSCGYGERVRTRECNNPPALIVLGEGFDCQGFAVDVMPGCNMDPCPVDGGVGSWGEWSICDKPCGNDSYSYRYRYCDNPTPAMRGEECPPEQLVQTKPCLDLQPCQSVTFDILLRFKDFEWNWKYYDLTNAETLPVVEESYLTVKEGLQNYTQLDSFDIVEITEGSVIVRFSVHYKYMKNMDLVDFIDFVNKNQFLRNNSVEINKVDSKISIPCTAPVITSVDVLDQTSVQVKWTTPVCNGVQMVSLYLIYTLDALTDPQWNTLGLPPSSTSSEIKHLRPASTYRAYLLPAVNYGNGVPSHVFYIQMPSMPPSKAPPSVATMSIASTKLYVSWENLDPQYTNGKLLGHLVKWKQYFDPTFQQIEIPFPFKSTTLKNLTPFQYYWIEVAAMNVAGPGPVEYSIVMTLEGVPSIAVPNVTIIDMQAEDWWAVEWGRIPPQYVNGVLLGYRLIYYLSYYSDVETSGEKQLIIHDFDVYTFFYKATKLTNYAIYDVNVVGFTAAGQSKSKTYQAKTCRCNENVFGNWYEHPLFTKVVGEGNLTGVFADIVKEVIEKSCGRCRRYPSSKMQYFVSKKGAYNQYENEQALKNAISPDVDVSFPVYLRASWQGGGVTKFFPVVNSPGCALIVLHEKNETVILHKVINNILKGWPLLLVSYLIATVFGLLVWFTDQFTNPNQFVPGSSIRGAYLGFWFTFITMTTVGYGDQAPRSRLARSLAIIWLLVGLVLNGLIIGYVTNTLTSLNEVQVSSLYDTKTAVLYNSFEYRYAILRSAKVSKEKRYDTMESMFDALERRDVDVIFVDMFATLPYKQTLQERGFKIKNFIKTDTAYGIMVSGNSIALQTDIASMLKEYEPFLSDYVAQLIEDLPEFIPPGGNDVTTNIFNSNSIGFKLTLKYLLYMIAGCATLGVLFDLFKCSHKTFRVRQQETIQEALVRITSDIGAFRAQLSEKMAAMQREHDRERFELLQMQTNYRKKVKSLGRSEVDRRVYTSFDNTLNGIR